MKVVKRNVSKVNNLRDFFVRELNSEPMSSDIVKESIVNGNRFRVFCHLYDDNLKVVVSVWNEQAGIDLGIREYSILLFSDEKLKIKLPNESVGLAIVELLESYNVSLEPFGSGYSTEWMINDTETTMSKIWFSEDFKYFSITTKEIEPIEETISKEVLLDKLGL